MLNFAALPQPPSAPNVSYTSVGAPKQINPPQLSQQPKDLGFSFDGLVSDSAKPMPPTEIVASSTGLVTDTTSTPVKRGRPKKEKPDTPPNSKEIVENTSYDQVFDDTNNMAYGIIQQSDVLMNELKGELDAVRAARTLKGRYLYMNNLVQTMNGLMSTKIQAIREINNSHKNAYEAEYRRYKDAKAADAGDDVKATMDAYTAWISAPVGAPQYQLPTTRDITAGTNGVIISELPGEVEKSMDAGFNNFMNNLTPEQNLMILDSNPNIEEVVVFDQATGAKTFKWMNTKTGEFMNNLPPSSNLTIEDFTIDPLTRMAKNVNLNVMKKVIYTNEGKFDKY